MTSGMRVIFDKKESSAREKVCKKGTKMCPFAPPMVSLKSVPLRLACQMFIVGADFGDMKTGDLKIMREYIKPILR